ncbi:MAG: UDP-N-acetylmuramoyl-tripeptide--D-alanyl-D-alanine ligase [Rikenellaceae bacterium]
MQTQELYKLFIESSGVSTDSRAITPCSIFFALKGDNFNGNNFALSALEAGAQYSVVDDKTLPANNNLIQTEDVLTALQDLARYHRAKLRIPVVGLTGTNGKTTTKELITTVLSTKYKVISTQGNLNNHIGVPLTLLKMDSATQIGVVEMGASAPGEIATLVSISQPNYGLITNVGKAHLLGFGSFEGVKNTKGELYDYLFKTGGTAIYNIDNPDLCEMIEQRSGIKTAPYGVKHQKYSILPISSAEPFLRMKLHSGEMISTRLIGSYNSDNVMAALAVGKLFHTDLALAIEAIEKYTPSNNRSQLIKGKENTLIVDAYNANPTSMRAALENFNKMERTKTTLIIGDMLELGGESQNEHKAILNIIKEMRTDNLFFVGGEFASAAQDDAVLLNKAKFFKTSLELKEYLLANPVTGNTFLIKGSRGTRLERVLDVL